LPGGRRHPHSRSHGISAPARLHGRLCPIGTASRGAGNDETARAFRMEHQVDHRHFAGSSSRFYM
jgi:hypothetical protein